MINMHQFSQTGTGLKNLKSKSKQSYKQISVLHDKFTTELKKYEHDKQAIMEKIINLFLMQQIIIVDLCTYCEQADLLDLGRFVIKAHLQNLEIVKLFIKNLLQFVHSASRNISTINETNYLSCAPHQAGGYYRDLQLNKYNTESGTKNVNYYRIRQNSQFQAQGIGYQIKNIQDQVQNNRRNELQQMHNILKNKQLVQSIQPSQNEKILFEAVGIMSHHSEVFRKLTKNNKEAFIENYKGLNVKPYSVIKNEIDQIMKQKVSKANQKLMNKMQSFIKNKIANSSIAENSSKVYNCLTYKQIQDHSYGVQVNFTKYIQENNRIEQKKKQQIIKQLTSSMNYQKTRAQKLQKLLTQKTNYFQQKLVRTRYEKSKEDPMQFLKKSCTSIQNLTSNIQNIDQDGNNEQINISGILDCCNSPESGTKNKNNLNNRVKRKQLRLKQQVAYQKSLKRIQFDLSNQFEETNSQYEGQEQQTQQKSQMDICNLQVDFTYNPAQGVFQQKYVQKLRQQRQNRKKRLSYFFNAFDLEFNFASAKTVQPSLLTIKNIKKYSKLNINANIQRNRMSNRKSTLFNKTSNINMNSADQKRYSCKNIVMKNSCRNFNNKLLTEIFVSNFADVQNQRKQEKNKQVQQKKKFKIISSNMINFMNLPQQSNQTEETIQNLCPSEHQNILKQVKNNQDNVVVVKRRKEGKFMSMNMGKFQLINFDQDKYQRNKGNLNLMLTELKKKRRNYYRQKQLGCYSPNYCKKSQNSSFNYNCHEASKNIGKSLRKSLLEVLYFSEQNAMQAQLQFGVSVAKLIAQRKGHKQNISQTYNYKINIQNQEYYEYIGKKIQKVLYDKCRKQPKYFHELQFFIKCPLSYMKARPNISRTGKDTPNTHCTRTNSTNINLKYENIEEQELDGFKLKQNLNLQDIKNFVKFITSLHSSQHCQGRPCEHLRSFLSSIGISVPSKM